MTKMLSLTLLSAVVSLLLGCETSNQNYGSSGRVVDATAASTISRNQGLAASGAVVDNTASGGLLAPANPNGGTLSDSPVAPSVGTGTDLTLPPSVYQSGAVSSTGQVLDVGILSGVGPSPDPEAGLYPAGSLIGGVPDSSMPESSTTTTTNTTLNASSSVGVGATNNGGAGLLAANTTTTSTAAVAAPRQPDSSSATIYQNKIATTAGPDRYQVVKGDTLYSIAFRYGLDYHALAKINKIDPPYNLAVGQILILNLKAQEAPSYVVQKGDTLYSIARKNGQSVEFLAGVNNLEPPYTLKLGQKLLLSRTDSSTPATQKQSAEVPVAGGSTTTTAQTTPAKSTNTNTASQPAKTTTAKPTQTAQTTTPIVKTKSRQVSGVTWSWPTTSGRVIEQFSSAEQGNKGIDISGQRGQAVLAAADGQVVYSGNALRGFGNLIIINHSNEYLSAYAHNDALLVKEGQKVQRGQQIARMGNTDASSVRLHFEIRYRGQSVNPISYLPK